VLQFLLLMPFAGAAAVLLFGVTPRVAFGGALGFSILSLGLAVAAFLRYGGEALSTQVNDVNAPWISNLGVNLHFGYDGISLLFVLLTSILTPVAILVAGFTIRERLHVYLGLLLFLEGALVGVFLALDLVVFYFAWEAVLIPAYFLIGAWGGERRVYAAFKYLIYTMVGSLLMLVGILLLFAQSTPHTFNLLDLAAHPMSQDMQKPVFLVFALAFGIKAAVFPFHSWVPDVYGESAPPTAIMVSGVLSKMGIYGFIRLCLLLFPDASRYFAPSESSMARSLLSTKQMRSAWWPAAASRTWALLRSAFSA
jgi:NADH-quinone oxidoreductase subunit M